MGWCRVLAAAVAAWPVAEGWYGGNVIVTLKEGRNLPLPAVGLASTYVTVRAGGALRGPPKRDAAMELANRLS